MFIGTKFRETGFEGRGINYSLNVTQKIKTF
jgi:hypothetical protein